MTGPWSRSQESWQRERGVARAVTTGVKLKATAYAVAHPGTRRADTNGRPPDQTAGLRGSVRVNRSTGVWLAANPRVNAWDENPQRFIWTKTCEQIIDSLARVLQ